MESKKFDYSFLKQLLVPADFASLFWSISKLQAQTEQEKKKHPDIFTSLRQIAIIQSVKGSNAIEGIVSTDQRIRDIVEKDSAPLNHNEREIKGYRDALAVIHEHHDSLRFSEDDLFLLHRTMLSYADVPYLGKYKEKDSVIREVHRDGTSSIRWMPTSASDTREAMGQLFLAYLDADNDSDIHPLLLIPCVVLDFLCIHPFSDGNGRMSRLISLLLLYHAGIDLPAYISFEEKTNENKWRYYEALKQSSLQWHENQNDYTPFMLDFLTTLWECYRELDKRLLTVKDEKVNKAERVEQAVLSAMVPISKEELLSLLPDVSASTVERVLSTMVKEGKVEKLGSTRAARYRKARK